MVPYLKAENPPNNAPDAIPTEKPIMKPILTRSKQLGPCAPGSGGAGIITLKKKKPNVVDLPGIRLSQL